MGNETRRVGISENEIVYGPVVSRRLGLSLGINLNVRRRKTCTFDCVYCQYGRTLKLVSSSKELCDWLSEEKILKVVENQLRRLNSRDVDLDSITFSGLGEPTLYPNLIEVIRGTQKLRDEYSPGVEVDVLTNSSLITNKSVFQALLEIDSVVAKLDAGGQASFEHICRPATEISPLRLIVEGLIHLQEETERVKIQTLIFKSASPTCEDNSNWEEIKNTVEKVISIQPLEMQIYTVSRRPSEPFVHPISNSLLEEVTNKINCLMGNGYAKFYV